MIPPTGYIESTENPVVAEDIVFDKANEIARIEKASAELRAKVMELKSTKDKDVDSAPLLDQLARAEEALQALRKET